MSLTISPLTIEDIPTAVRIKLEAFKPHPRTAMIWTRGYNDQVYTYGEVRLYESLNNAGCRLMKAVDDLTGRIAAVAEWTFALDPVENAQRRVVELDEPPPTNWPEGGNWGISRFFKRNTEMMYREYFAGVGFIALDILTTNPEFRGRGAGARLLDWGIEQADRLSLPMCLESTPAGLRLYTERSFKEARVIEANMRQFGWEQAYDEEAARRVLMIREAR